MKRKDIRAKVMPAVLATTMMAGTVPATAFAATGSQVAADGTYKAEAKVTRTAEDDENEDVWDEYDVTVTLEVKDGKFANVTVTPGDTYDTGNDSYFEKAYSKSKGIVKKIQGQDATEDSIKNWDSVSGATRTSTAVKEAALDAVHQAEEAKPEEPEAPIDVTDHEEKPYKYVYAALTWAEYWAAEGVQAAGSAASSAEADAKGELDKGAFDTVSRATTNHGLHRGSYQCTATIYMKDGKTYDVAYYTGATSAVLTDGTEISYSKSDIDHYVVTGLKYVPVKVASEDYEAFCKKYTVVENGGKLSGGFSENKLAAYTDVEANVTEATNGLKSATKNADGSFSFSGRTAGGESGIKDRALKTASGVEVNVKEANGSYGEFLRVDLNGNYGDLAANMQTVKWTYYGDDSTYSKALASYGTKFAADNWMHKAMGIQLGLTDSLRTTLPEGTDGTGYWALTVYALGYEDYTVKFEAADANIVKADPVKDTSALEAAIAKAESLNQDDYTEDSWTNMQTELTEAKEELDKKHSQSAVDEATEHLNAAIAALAAKPVQEEVYVLMNIPYAEFYQSELNGNSVPVDAFTSATKSKPKSGSLAGGSYHVNSDGSDITGVVFPVKVDENVDLRAYKAVKDDDTFTVTVNQRGQQITTTYTGKETLFENPSYAYYPLSEKPSYYKELTVGETGNLTFGKTVGDVKTLSGLTPDFTTETGYGDYELDIDGLSEAMGFGNDDQVNGVVVHTTEGQDYGLRHMENIWRVSYLSWSTGLTADVHGCPTSSAHYESMMGQHISGVTYYTTKGIFEIPFAESIYVPKKFESKVSAENAAVTSGKINVSIAGLPADYQAAYSVDGLSDIEVSGDTLSFDKTTAKKGNYTLKVTDESGVYAGLKTTFELYTEDKPAAYNAEKKGLEAAEGFTQDDLADYLKNIKSVTVGDKSYQAGGRGAVALIDKETGTIKEDAAPFAEGETFALTVEATGYQPFSFTYSKKAAEEPTAVEYTIISGDKGIYTIGSNENYTLKADGELADFKGLQMDGEDVDPANYTASQGSTVVALESKYLDTLTPGEHEVSLQYADGSAKGTFTIAAEDTVVTVDKSSLVQAIKNAESLKEADYTADSWKTLQSVLSTARNALSEMKGQKEVDQAATALNQAISELKKAENKEPSGAKKSDSNAKSGSTAATEKNTAKNTSKAAKTGDTAGIMGLLAAMTASIGAGSSVIFRRRRRKDEE